MDWDSLYSEEYANDLNSLEYEPKAVNYFDLKQGQLNHDPSFEMQRLNEISGLETWLDDHPLDPLRPMQTLKWSLQVLVFRRGARNMFERSGDSSGDQLATVGCSRAHFETLHDTFDLSKAFPAYILSDQACFAKRLHYNAQSKIDQMTYTLRSSHLVLRDLAMSSTYSAARREVFALIMGCTEADIRRVKTLLATMKAYAGHPLLIVALFLELQHKSLTARYRELRQNYFKHWVQTLGPNAVTIADADMALYRKRAEEVSRLDQNLDALTTEIVAFQIRLPDTQNMLSSMPRICPDDQRQYMETYGNLLASNLDNLRCENQYLQAKTSTLGQNTETLISSLWNVITMNENQLSKEIARASKRDSTVMSAITVGTLFFFPGTFVATMFAMPLFDWTAKNGDNVTGDRFWIYWAVTVPLTVVVLALLFIWFRIHDQRESESKKEYPERSAKQDAPSWLSSHMLRRRRNASKQQVLNNQTLPRANNVASIV